MDAERLLAGAFLEAHPGDAAPMLEGLAPEDAAALLESVSLPAAAAVLQRMTWLGGAECLSRLPAERAAALVAALPLDAAAHLLRRSEVEPRERVLGALAVDAAGALRRLLTHAEGTAGALMDPRVLALPQDIPVSEARARVRRAPRHVLYYVYVVDAAQALVGVLNLRELMLASAQAPLATVMRTHVARLAARADRAAIVAHPAWREVHALPVVDDAGILVGAIRYETLRQLEDESADTSQAPDGLGAVLTLVEAAWMGLGGLLAEFAAALASTPRRPEEDDHGLTR